MTIIKKTDTKSSIRDDVEIIHIWQEYKMIEIFETGSF
jgi:hypothetical protein